MMSVKDEFLAKISDIESKYNELENFLSRSEVISDNKLYTHFSTQKKQLEKCMALILSYRKTESKIKENLELLSLMEDEVERQKLGLEIEELGKQENSEKEEICVYLSETKFSQPQTAAIEISGKNPETIASFTEFLVEASKFLKADYTFENQKFTLSGHGVYDKLKNFSGKIKFVLRGREDTLTVAVLSVQTEAPEFSERDVEIQTLKSGGAGGQHINKTESAVRLAHIPTGIVALCQDERSQTSNKQRAMENLRQKVESYYEKNMQKNIEIQRKKLKNAVFSETPAVIFDFDGNVLTFSGNKKSYKLSEILKGDMKLLFSEIV